MITEEVKTLSPKETMDMLQEYYSAEEDKVVSVSPTLVGHVDRDQYDKTYYVFGFEIVYEGGKTEKKEESEVVTVIEEMLHASEEQFDSFVLLYDIKSFPRVQADFKGSRIARTLSEKVFKLKKD